MKSTASLFAALSLAWSSYLLAAERPLAPPAIPSLESWPAGGAGAEAARSFVNMWRVPLDPEPDRAPPAEDDPTSHPPVDVRAYLESAAAKANREDFRFAPGEEALYDRKLAVLMVRASPEMMARVALFMQAIQWDLSDKYMFSSFGVHVEVLLVEFPAAKVPGLSAPLPATYDYETLREAVGDSWRVLSRLMLTTKSGQRAVTSSKAAGAGAIASGPDPATAVRSVSAEDSPDAALQRGETGSALQAEPVVGPDGKIMDVNMVYHFRAPGAAGAAGVGGASDEWHTACNVILTDGKPVVVQLSSAPSSPDGDPSRPAKVRALILRGDAVSVPSWPPPLPWYLRPDEPVQKKP